MIVDWRDPDGRAEGTVSASRWTATALTDTPAACRC
jgi:hypothetical protein